MRTYNTSKVLRNIYVILPTAKQRVFSLLVTYVSTFRAILGHYRIRNVAFEQYQLRVLKENLARLTLILLGESIFIVALTFEVNYVSIKIINSQFDLRKTI